MAVILAASFLILASVIPLVAEAQTCDKPGGLVPCGRLCDDPDTPQNETRACQLCDIFELIDRIWKFLLTVLVPGVAIVLFIAAGILILLYGANPGLQATGKSIFKTTVWGLIIIFGAWMLTNTVMRSLAGDSLNPNSRWYEIQCGGPDIGRPPPPTQRYACGSQGCVANASGQFNNLAACQSQCPASSGDACTRPQVLAQQHSNARYPRGNAPELDQLISCVMSNRDIATFIDQNQIFTFERDREICNYTRADGHCTSACAHRRNSCHYGGASGTTGAQGVDFNARGISERALFDMLRALERQCNFGPILFETDHTHISTRSCAGN